MSNKKVFHRGTAVLASLIGALACGAMTAQASSRWDIRSTTPQQIVQQPSYEDLDRQARELFERGDYKGSIRLLNQSIELYPDNGATYYNRGLVRQTAGDPQGAIADYTEAIRLNPKDAVAYNNRGNVHADTGNKQSALDDYNRALSVNPKYAVAYYNRGNTRSELGDKQGAIKDYTQAVRINPNYAKAYYNRGFDRNNLGDKSGAIEDFRTAAELFAKQGDREGERRALSNLRSLQ